MAPQARLSAPRHRRPSPHRIRQPRPWPVRLPPVRLPPMHLPLRLPPVGSRIAGGLRAGRSTRRHFGRHRRHGLARFALERHRGAGHHLGAIGRKRVGADDVVADRQVALGLDQEPAARLGHRVAQQNIVGIDAHPTAGLGRARDEHLAALDLDRIDGDPGRHRCGSRRHLRRARHSAHAERRRRPRQPGRRARCWRSRPMERSRLSASTTPDPALPARVAGHWRPAGQRPERRRRIERQRPVRCRLIERQRRGRCRRIEPQRPVRCRRIEPRRPSLPPVRRPAPPVRPPAWRVRRAAPA